MYDLNKHSNYVLYDYISHKQLLFHEELWSFH